jgi:hypothetical protein
VLFDVSRPAILNGIDDVVTRPDLAQRSLFAKLEPIPEDKRKTEDEILTAFEAKRPVILGALLDGVSTGLRREASIKPRNYPRMADFALWATACETAAWRENTFGPAYSVNIEEAIDAVLDADIIATAVCTMMMKVVTWEGTATLLLLELEAHTIPQIVKSRGWPADHKGLSGRLRRNTEMLRKRGIELEFNRRGRGRNRTITIRRVVASKSAEITSASSATSAHTAKDNENNDIAANGAGPGEGAGTSQRPDPSSASSVREDDADYPPKSTSATSHAPSSATNKLKEDEVFRVLEDADAADDDLQTPKGWRIEI